MTAAEDAIALARVIAAAAVDKQAESVRIIDVSAQLAITDCFVLASADNDRLVRAIIDEVEEKARELLDRKPVRREGEAEGRWVLLDFVDVVVHIQHREERTFYALDQLWNDCPEISVEAS